MTTDKDLENLGFMINRLPENPGPPDKKYDELKKGLDEYNDRLIAGVSGSTPAIEAMVFLLSRVSCDKELEDKLDQAIHNLKIFLGKGDIKQ